MSSPISPQHPAVVLRSHYVHLRALFAAAMIAVVCLTGAVVALAITDEGTATPSIPVTRSAPAPKPYPLPFVLPADKRYDGGPEEGTRGPQPVPDTRYDGGPDEGTRGPQR